MIADQSPDLPTPQLTGPRRWVIRVSVLVIVLAGLIVYWNSFSGAMIFDDSRCIKRNQELRKLWPPWKTGSSPGRTVVNFSLAVNYAIGELEVRGYHIFNLSVHILAGLALYGIIRRSLLLEGIPDRLGRSAHWIALATALIWTVHPLQTQSVTYLIQRAESMMGMFLLVTLYCLIRGTQSTRRPWWFVGGIVSCALGMGCKEVMALAGLVVLR